MSLSKVLPRKPKKAANRIRPVDLAPDGVRIMVDWAAIKPGMSVFVPAVDLGECVSQVYEITALRGWKVDHAVRIEGGKQGVRFWRIL